MVIGGAFISVLSIQSTSYSCDDSDVKKLVLKLAVEKMKEVLLLLTKSNQEKLEIEQSLTKLELTNIRTAEKHENIKKSKCNAELVSSDGKDLSPHAVLGASLSGIAALTNSKAALSIIYTVQSTESGQTYVEIPR